MNKATYYIAAMILGFSMSAQAQFSPSYAEDEVEASQQMSSATGRTSQREEVLRVRTIPNPWFTMEPTVGYVSSNFSGIEGKNNSSVDAVSRMQGGVGFLVGRGMWQGETGLLYSQRGGQLKLVNTGYTSSYDFTLTYIDIPVMARFSWPHSSKSHFFARAGVIVGILSDAKYDATMTSTYNGYTQSYSNNGVDTKSSFNSTDIRGAFGAGYDWKFARRMGLVVQADLQESLSKVNTGDFLSGLDVYNFGIVVSAGLSIKL
ncbi:outer membrane beta-barrel protein [Bdellovibrio sp. HCB209]|uniref:outer membrane beta-barrel protein n=1 Tax=Bdellovibrio sp. HCB209 TaxID=3394354 RepID=UPI0039B5A7DC